MPARRAPRTPASALGELHRAVVIAVIAVRMVKVPADEVADVIAVRHGLVSAAFAVYVPARVALTVVAALAVVRIFSPDLERAVVHVIVVNVVQMTAV